MQKHEDNLATQVDGAGLVPMPGVTVTVIDQSTGLAAALYSDNGVTLITTPIVTDNTGYYGFFAADGRYTITFTNPRIVTFTRDVILEDPKDNPYATLAQLAAPTGSTNIGNGTETVADSLNALQLADYTALRSYAGPRKSVYVTGYLSSVAPSGIVGPFTRDDSDTTSADNGGTIIVAANGKRWKRAFSGAAYVEWFGAKGDGITDDLPAIQSAINAFLGIKATSLECKANTYRVTNAINLRIAGSTNSDKLVFHGAGETSTVILLDNAAATSTFAYDNGWTTGDLTACTTTSGSATITTTGSFAGVAMGSFISLPGAVGNVQTVTSNTQIVLDRNAYLSGSGVAGKWYNTNATAANRIDVSGFQIKNTANTSPKVSWHQAYAFRLNGVVNSSISNIRADGFTRCIDTLGGWINTCTNVTANECRTGFNLNLPTYRWVFDRCTTINCGDGTANNFGFQAINGGALEFRNHISEIDSIGVNLMGVKGFTFTCGNFESSAFSQTIMAQGLPWALNDEEQWTQGGVFDGIRFYNILGFLFNDGVKGIRIRSCVFTVNVPPFTPNGQSWIRTNATDDSRIRDIDDSGNTFPVGYDSVTHIVSPTAYPTLAMAQSITRNGKRYASAIPYYGGHWKVGDIVERLPSSIVAGGIQGWVCTAASTGVDGSATWKTYGTVQA